LGVVLCLLANLGRIRYNDFYSSMGGEVMGLSKRGGSEGALAFATGEAVAVPAGMISSAVDAGYAVWKRVDTGFVGWVSGGAVRGLLW
jgi:hypothetical protein